MKFFNHLTAFQGMIHVLHKNYILLFYIQNLTAGLEIKFNPVILPLCLLYLHFLSIQQLRFHYLHLKMLPLPDVFGLSRNKTHIKKKLIYF